MKAKERIAAALERMAPAPLAAPDFGAADAFVWHVSPDRLDPVQNVNRVDIDLLVGIDRSRNILLENTRQFANGLPANNALLWGARGMGKSSLVKAAHAACIQLGIRREFVPRRVRRPDPQLRHVRRLLGAQLLGQVAGRRVDVGEEADAPVLATRILRHKVAAGTLLYLDRVVETARRPRAFVLNL